MATCSHSDASASGYNVATPQATATPEPTPIPEATRTPVEVRRAMLVHAPVFVRTYAEYEKLPSGTDVIWPNGDRWRKP